ncbi:MAG: DUF1501 domain-containing protein [Acidobacteriota bacterium]
MNDDTRIHHGSCCGRVNRRVFLGDCGMGFTGLVLGAMLQRDGILRASASSELWTPPDGKPHFAPKAKRVIWLFMLGGTSHLESFDPKPELNKYADYSIDETPYKSVLDSPLVKKNVQEVVADRKMMKKIFPLQVGYRKHGQSGIEVTDWWPNLAGCVDDLAVVRSMWTTDNDHGAQLQFHQGRHMFDGFFPSIGSWIHYGLGSLSDSLPQFVVFAEPEGNHQLRTYDANYLGPEHNGVLLSTDPQNPLPFGSRAPEVLSEEQRAEFEFIKEMNQMAAVRYPADAAIRARIKSYELAFKMQLEIPRVFDFKQEPEHVHKLYGLDQDNTRPFGQVLLTARRLVESGVRFVQIVHGKGTAGSWDAHSELKKNHSELCAQVDKPIAGLLKDLKQRGLLEETLVVWGTEFGRTPGVEGAKGGRDHHPFGFSVWLAGGGIKGGVVHGATDELGFHAVESRHYVTDLHATVLHQLGLDPHKLEVPGHKRIELDYGRPIKEIIA